MLSQKETYTITSLCKDDDEAVKKINDAFYDCVHRIFEKNQDLEKYIGIVQHKVGRTWRTDVNQSEYIFRRVSYTVTGEKELIDQFFSIWKEIDKNPYQHFRVVHELSLSSIINLMNIREEENV